MANLSPDLTGQSFGRLTAVQRVENDTKGRARWSCRCTCGCEYVAQSYRLLRGHTTSCGCERTNDLTGQTFDRLTVIERGEDYVSPKGKRSTRWVCRCVCGEHTLSSTNNLRRGKSTSCGCKLSAAYAQSKREQYAALRALAAEAVEPDELTGGRWLPHGLILRWQPEEATA